MANVLSIPCPGRLLHPQQQHPWERSRKVFYSSGSFTNSSQIQRCEYSIPLAGWRKPACSLSPEIHPRGWICPEGQTEPFPHSSLSCCFQWSLYQRLPYSPKILIGFKFSFLTLFFTPFFSKATLANISWGCWVCNKYVSGGFPSASHLGPLGKRGTDMLGYLDMVVMNM